MESVLGKSNKISEMRRNEGNKIYMQKNFFDAILKYNESLCFAENGSENTGYAYANRSAVFFEMKMYEKALENIKMAKLHNYPEKSYKILKNREEKCREMMKINLNTKSDEMCSMFFKLSHEAHKNLPNIAKCLELKCDDKYGRHVITNAYLKVGDIVAIDEAVFKVIKSDKRYSTCFDDNIYQRCCNCLHENMLDLIPCEFCNKTMFCSQICRDYALSHHHKYECPIIDDLLKSGIKHIVLRMFFESLSLFNGNICEFEKFILQNENVKLTIFDLYGKTNEEKNYLVAVLSLGSFESTRDSLDEYEEFFMKTETLKSMWKENKSFISKILTKFIIIGNRDVHGIGGWSLKLNQEEPKNPIQHQQLIANACYLFSSFLNHSCCPNVKRLNVGIKNVIVVSRPILPGQQLFDSYRQNFNLQPKEQRQESLLNDYGFKCDCEACVNNWPLNQDLQIIDDDLLEFAWEAYGELPTLSENQAIKKIKKYCNAITENHNFYPSAELVILQECISNCLLLITKPFQFS